MADDDEQSGRTVRMYDRPADADKPAANPMMRVLLIVAAVLVLALLLAHFVFHVHFRHLLHAGIISPLHFVGTGLPPTALGWMIV